jgi:hypothetical protein
MQWLLVYRFAARAVRCERETINQLPRRNEGHMEFRWAMIISLWTLLAGPAFDSSGPSGQQRRQQPSIAASPAKILFQRATPE